MPLTNAMLRDQQLAEKDVRPVRTSVRERSYSDETITPEISLTVSTVLAAFMILCQDISSLPLILYERRGRNKFRASGNPYYRLMHDEPNPEHTSMVFREFIEGHLLGWGNFFAQPIFDKRGDVVELWPLRPDRMTIKRFEGERVYIYNQSDGKQRVFLSDEIFHIPGFGFDGISGYSLITLGRNPIGASISADKFSSKFFANGLHAGVTYTYPGKLSEKAYENLSTSIAERTGVGLSNKPIILEEGISLEKLSIPPNDAQFLETRKFNVGEIARIFRIPPHMLGDVERSTSWGTGIDSQEQGYVNHTLRPWVKRIEEHLNARLLPKQDRDTLFYEHLMDGLLRGDIQTRYQAYVHAIVNGIMSRNEVRERENLNPRKGLDDILQPLNMTTVGNTGNEGNSNDTTALGPLWKDATARVLKRETNDLMGAVMRYQVKGKQAEFEAWVDQFYSVDHVRFAMKQFSPLLDAHERLFGVENTDALQAFVQEYFDDRRLSLKHVTAENISDGMETYLARAAEDFLTFVSARLSVVRESGDLFDELEEVYE